MAGSPRPGEPRPPRLPPVPPLYPIIDIDLCRHRGAQPEALAVACLRGGARLLQVRQKSGGSGMFVSTVHAIVQEARQYEATIIVNDRPDLALLAGAAGTHVGQEDLAVAAVRAMCGERAVIGLSTHTRPQVDEALDADVDYVAVGPIFGTDTKQTGYSARGLDLVRYAAGRGKPVVAIGGIDLARAAVVIAAGAAAVAVISDLLTDADPETRVRRYLDLLR